MAAHKTVRAHDERQGGALLIAVDRVIQKQNLSSVLVFLMIEPVTAIGCNALVPFKGTMVTGLGSVYYGDKNQD